MSAVPSTSLLTTTVQTNAICSSNVCATTTITPTTTTINNNITINIGHSKGGTDKNNNNNANSADKTDQEMTDKNNNSKSSDNGDNSSNNDNRSASSLKQLKSSLRLDFSSSSYKKQTYAGDLFSLFKNSPGFFTQASATTPTPTKVLYPTDVTMAQRQYAQGFLDALAQVQKLNGFVPAPSLLNSPSFLTPLIPSANANGDPAKTVNSPVLTSPTRSEILGSLWGYEMVFQRVFDNREPLSVIMQAMSGMGGFAGCGFPPLTPTSSFYSPVVSQPPPVSVPSPMVGGGLSQPSLTSQGQAPGPAQAHVQTHQSHLHHPQQTTSAATAAAASGTAQIPHSQSQLCPPLSLPQSMIPSTSSVVLNPLAGSTQHQLLHSGGSAILQGAGPGSVPVTAPLTHQIKNEMTCSSASDESKESSYDMYANESNNDTEACSSTRSNASPRSQDEIILPTTPFQGDRRRLPNLLKSSISFSSEYDLTEQERKKLERKRARNRMAATKCRQRKLQKITDLERQVNEEKATGSQLSQELKILEASISQLRQALHEHRNRGCVIPTK